MKKDLKKQDSGVITVRTLVISIAVITTIIVICFAIKAVMNSYKEENEEKLSAEQIENVTEEKTVVSEKGVGDKEIIGVSYKALMDEGEETNVKEDEFRIKLKGNGLKNFSLEHLSRTGEYRYEVSVSESGKKYKVRKDGVVIEGEVAGSENTENK